jgi:thiamine pyrophosphate-dependent acetolactate synthase large subunit-like protein
MNAAELFVKCLENEGVTGEENAHFMMALEKSPIDFILCRHEQGAAFMADSRPQHKESHQNMDGVSMFKPISKWTKMWWAENKHKKSV